MVPWSFLNSRDKQSTQFLFLSMARIITCDITGEETAWVFSQEIKMISW